MDVGSEPFGELTLLLGLARLQGLSIELWKKERSKEKEKEDNWRRSGRFDMPILIQPLAPSSSPSPPRPPHFSTFISKNLIITLVPLKYVGLPESPFGSVLGHACPKPFTR